jgi:hypothetical protein
MKAKINGLIKKFKIELAYKNGQEGLAVRGKPSAAEVAELKELKSEIMAELKRRAAERRAAEKAKKAAEEAARQEEIRAMKAGELKITLHYHDGEYLSGYEVFGAAADLLEELGLAEYVDGWGYHVADAAVKALGKEFTYSQAVEYTRPAREAAEAQKAAADQKRKAKFERARETGRPVLLAQWTEPCSDPREECSLDIVQQYAMPDGSVKTERNHTW